MWNLKNKISKQTKQKRTHKYREQTGGCQSGAAGLGGKGDGIKKYALAVTTVMQSTAQGR